MATVHREDAGAIQTILQHGSRALDPETSRPLFAFRLHQFLSKGDTVYVLSSLLDPLASAFVETFRIAMSNRPNEALSCL